MSSTAKALIDELEALLERFNAEYVKAAKKAKIPNPSPPFTVYHQIVRKRIKELQKGTNTQ